LRAATGEAILADDALADKEVILYYFSAHWCPPCRSFSPVLAEIYAELTKEEEPLEVIFVSEDKTSEVKGKRDSGPGF